MDIPNWVWSLLAGTLLVVALVGVSGAFQSESTSARVTAKDSSDEAPNFALKTLDGEVFRLEEHRGEVVVLNFWATWCPPCRREIPDFVSLQQDLGDRGLQFVGVALERSAGPKKVRAFAEQMNINYPIGLGDGSIADKYGGVRGLPMTFVIGPEGNIRKRIPGMTTKDLLRPLLEALL